MGLLASLVLVLLIAACYFESGNGLVPPSPFPAISKRTKTMPKKPLPTTTTTTLTRRRLESITFSSSLTTRTTKATSSTTALQSVAGAGMATSTRRGNPNNSVANSIIKGRLWGFLSKFIIGPDRYWIICQKLFWTICRHDNLIDCVIIICLIKLPLPLARRFYRLRHPELLTLGKVSTTDDDDDDNNDSDFHSLLLESRFLRSKTHRMAYFLNEVGILFAIFEAVELGLVVLDELGFQFVRIYPCYQWITGIVTSLWGARNLSEFKEFVLTRGNQRDSTLSSGIKMWSQFLDVLIYVGTVLVILDFLSVQTGFALKSLFGLSSISTLVFSLASKELVSEFLSSLAIQGTNMYKQGERIMLQDGTVGTVQKLGWLNTHIRRGDELVVQIPNSHLAGERIANISRSRRSNVKQALTLSYHDMDKLPKLIEDIKVEIRKSCPTLIDGGSRSFQVFWTEYKEHSLEVVVSAYFRTKPMCDAYWEVRQEVLKAIARATKKNNIKFSYADFVPMSFPLFN